MKRRLDTRTWFAACMVVALSGIGMQQAVADCLSPNLSQSLPQKDGDAMPVISRAVLIVPVRIDKNNRMERFPQMLPTHHGAPRPKRNQSGPGKSGNHMPDASASGSCADKKSRDNCTALVKRHITT